jgi:hypothetical protein
MGCYVRAVDPQPPKTDAVWDGHSDGAIYSCTFSGAFAGTATGVFWSATDPAGPGGVDPGVLAQQALASLTIPAPTTGRYPAGRLQDGRPYTAVNAYTWYWTDPGTYRALTARADAGGVWAQVTVTPTGLTFTPGDGEAAMACAGPGTAWTASFGVWAASPTHCDYRYRHSSIHQPNQTVTATYGIRWQVTWTSSTGQVGTLAGLTTTATATFAVAELESVVIK